jgi:hypothetical protein
MILHAVADGSDPALQTPSTVLDQCPQVFAGELTNLDAKTLGLCVELRPVGETSGRRVEEPKQAARRGGRRPQTRRPSRSPNFAGPAHSDNTMTLAIYTRAKDGMQDSATAALEETFGDLFSIRLLTRL